MNTHQKYVATCLFGLESLVGEEIDLLGGKRTETIDGRVCFEAPLADLPKYNINLRYAERVLVETGRAEVLSFEQLFDAVYSMPWEDYIEKNDCFPVKGHSIKSKLFSLPDCQRIIKKAVAKRLGSKYGLQTLPEDGAVKQIEFFIFKDVACLMIDTSGDPLHKRGYRKTSTEAPLRETLAAAMVKLSHPREDVLLWDPMCGSGTIAIEAAMLMSNTAPGLNRFFAAEDYGWLTEDDWENARDEAVEKICDTSFRARATDIDPSAVEIARENIRKAGMSKYIECYVKDALTIETEGMKGTVICNPPYGERLSTVKEAERLYSSMGRQFSKLDKWQIYVLTADDYFEKLYGRRADKVRKLYNGMIKCGYYQFFKPIDGNKKQK